MNHSSSSTHNRELQPMTQKEQKEFNKWCKEFRVSSQYVKKTQYYPNEYHYEQPINSTILDWIENILVRIFK